MYTFCLVRVAETWVIQSGAYALKWCALREARPPNITNDIVSLAGSQNRAPSLSTVLPQQQYHPTDIALRWYTNCTTVLSVFPLLFTTALYRAAPAVELTATVRSNQSVYYGLSAAVSLSNVHTVLRLQ